MRNLVREYEKLFGIPQISRTLGGLFMSVYLN